MDTVGTLLIMALIGGAAIPATAYWDEWGRAKRIACVAWIVVWLGPPLVALWIKGVIG